MDDYTENRFKYLKEKSTEELLAEIKDLREEIEYMRNVMNDKNASSEQKSEFENSDIPYNEEKIRYMQGLVDERYNDAMRIK